MGFTTLQRSDESVELMPYAAYASPSLPIGSTPFLYSAPQRIRRPVTSAVIAYKSGDYVGNPFDSRLEFYVETRIGDVWCPVYYLDIGDSGSAEDYIAKLSATENSANITPKSPGMVSGNIYSIIGEEWRVKYRVVGENADPFYADTVWTFGIWICPVG